ncbi:MAG: hypothetical protein ACWA5W_04170 [Phycisphaerales bacterium]
MNTHTTHRTEHIDHRLAALERSASRWRLAAISAGTLFAGVLIGGMGSANTQPAAANPKSVVGVTSVGDRIFRVHQDGSMPAIRIIGGERSMHGYFDWGKVKIDQERINRTIPQP